MNEPNIEILKNLYEFGGLLAYRVKYCDPIIFQVVHGRATFNEETAKNELDALKRAGFAAGIESFMVHFDGAFKK